MNSKKIFILLSCLTLLVTLNFHPALAKEQITFWTTEDEKDRVDIQKALAKTFEQKTGIQVQVIPVKENLLTQRITAAYAANSLPDVVFHPIDHTIGWFEEKILDAKSATDLIKELGEKTFGQGPLNLIKVKNGYAAVPMDGWGQLLLFRKDLFEKEKLAVPDTWDHILKAAVKLHNPPLLWGFEAATDPGQVYTQLSTAFQVRSIDPYGNPLTNLGVNFAITSAPPNATGQSLTNYSTTTNSSGNATTLLTLGRKTGTYIVSAALTTGVATSVPFFATATAGPLISLGLSPAVAVVPAGGYFPFTVIGYDSFNNQTSDPSVTWSVQNGGGTIDSIGVFYAGSTLGTYMNTVKVQTTTIGTTATVAIVSAAGESGTATYSGVPQPTPLPTLTPVPTPTMGPGVLYDVQVDPSVISALTNARIPIIAEGVDIFGNQVTGVSYTFQTTGDLGTIVQTGPTTAILQTGPSGLGTVTVTAQQGAIIRTANIAGSIGNGLNRRLVIEDIPSPQKVGVPFTISIAAKDTQNNFVTDYDGPIVLADTTATINPSVVQPNQNGIWYIQAVINLANPEVTITAAGDGMVGVSNIFAVEGEPAQIPGLAALGYGGGGLGTVLGASISALLEKMLLTEDINRYGLFRYLGAGFAAGLGILGASIGGGLMVARGLEAIGRNPYAKSRLQLNLYASVAAFVFAATLAVVACYLILG
mgnify:CR=1 FL=1